MSTDTEVECPSCKGIIFDNTNSIIFKRSLLSNSHHLYRVALVRCASCFALLGPLKDKLELVK